MNKMTQRLIISLSCISALSIHAVFKYDIQSVISLSLISKLASENKISLVDNIGVSDQPTTNDPPAKPGGGPRLYQTTT